MLRIAAHVSRRNDTKARRQQWSRPRARGGTLSCFLRWKQKSKNNRAYVYTYFLFWAPENATHHDAVLAPNDRLAFPAAGALSARRGAVDTEAAAGVCTRSGRLGWKRAWCRLKNSKAHPSYVTPIYISMRLLKMWAYLLQNQNVIVPNEDSQILWYETRYTNCIV